MRLYPTVDDDAYIGQGGGRSPPVAAHYDPLDDVFGPSHTETTSETAADRPDAHPSDMRRLQAEHVTAGYREGITVAKERTMQAGFDEGFSLGATLGLIAGRLLGTLEGIHEALPPAQDGHPVERLLTLAREELSTRGIFGADYWASDGNWSYAVHPGPGRDEVLFIDVAVAHPLIKKWTAVVDEQLASWKINPVYSRGDETEEEEEEEDGQSSARRDGSGVARTAPATPKALDW